MEHRIYKFTFESYFNIGQEFYLLSKSFDKRLRKYKVYPVLRKVKNLSFATNEGGMTNFLNHVISDKGEILDYKECFHTLKEAKEYMEKIQLESNSDVYVFKINNQRRLKNGEKK